MIFAIVLNRFLQIPDRRATATNNQELPKTCRNPDSEIALPKFAVSQNASSNNERMHQKAELQKWGAAVLAPHGAFGFTSGDGTSTDDVRSIGRFSDRSVRYPGRRLQLLDIVFVRRYCLTFIDERSTENSAHRKRKQESKTMVVESDIKNETEVSFRGRAEGKWRRQDEDKMKTNQKGDDLVLSRGARDTCRTFLPP